VRRRAFIRKALVHHRQGGAGERVLQVEIEFADQVREQQALVDERPAGEARNVEVGQARQLVLAGKFHQRVLSLLADREQLALKRVLVAGTGPACDDGLADDGNGLQHRGAQHRSVDWHVAPAEQSLAFLLNEMRETVLSDAPGRVVARQEAHGDSVIAGCG
jgi:hypothetical protein